MLTLCYVQHMFIKIGDFQGMLETGQVLVNEFITQNQDLKHNQSVRPCHTVFVIGVSDTAEMSAYVSNLDSG